MGMVSGRHESARGNPLLSQETDLAGERRPRHRTGLPRTGRTRPGGGGPSDRERPVRGRLHWKTVPARRHPASPARGKHSQDRALRTKVGEDGCSCRRTGRELIAAGTHTEWDSTKDNLLRATSVCLPDHFSHLPEGLDVDVADLARVVGADVDGKDVLIFHGAPVVLVDLARWMAKAVVLGQ